MGNALELPGEVGIVQVSRDQGGNHPVLKEALDIVLVLQDQTGMGSALVLLGQMIHQRSYPEQRAGWELRGLKQAILGLWEVDGCWQGQMG